MEDVATRPATRRIAPRAVAVFTAVEAVASFLLGFLTLAAAVSPAAKDEPSYYVDSVLFLAGSAVLWQARRQLRQEASGERLVTGGSVDSITGKDVLWVMVGAFVASNVIGGILTPLLAVVLVNDPSSPTGIAVTSAISQLGFEIGAALNLYVLCLDRRAIGLRVLGWRLPKHWIWFAAAVLLVIPAVVIGGVLESLTQNALPHLINSQCKQVRASYSGPLAIIAFPIVCVIVPAVEETLFRGLLFGYLNRRLATGIAIGVSAVIFSAFHLVPVLFLALAAVGAILAFAFWASESLYTGAVIHGLFNAVGLYFLLYTNSAC